MSSLKRLFGAPKKAVNHDTATEALQAAEEQLNKKQLFLEKKINEEIAKAKQFGLKNKRAALECLRKKALYEKQLELNDGALMKLQAQRNALDSALMNKNILDTMKTVNSAMKNIHKDMDVDKVHDLMDNVNEQQEIANEIAAAISMPTGTDLVDEDDLLRELEELTEEDVAEKLLDVHDVGELPAIPVGEPTRPKSKPSKKAEEASELANLEMWSA
ncbi:Charged multivesicular body protein 4a [Taenia solium]|eukprot:TsM_000265100 transcript=TsM_000265100 gene=TsM_000265100